ncbi:hypothetical protein IKF74_01000 [Candidatus Saccharibacteria bacterium]|nr:hypothetical protein [Candidatus Saccharibacteria bacterium]
MNKLKQSLVTLIAAFVVALGLSPNHAFADMEFAVSPMNQKIVLVPGEDYNGTFEVVAPQSSPQTFYYKLSVEPFSVDENYQPVYENNGDYNQIVDWVTLENETGSVEPNATARINFAVHTPENAPAGGQYAIIRVQSDYEMMKQESENAINIQNIMSIAHIIYAEVAGETERGGEIFDANVPSFLFSGNITGSATIKNTGNVHSDATYTMQVFPLFSSEEVFTNEESPKTNLIIPGATRTTTVTWEETPAAGIFHVVYNANFEGANSRIDKYVIVCPLWLLFIIILALFLLIFKIFWGKKKDKK